MLCIPARTFALDEKMSDPTTPNTLAAAPEKTGTLRSSSRKDSYVAQNAQGSKNLRRSSSLEINDAIKKNITTAEPWLYHKQGFVLSIANRSTLTNSVKIEKSHTNTRGTIVKGQLQSKKKGPLIISGNAATIASLHPTDDGY